MAINLSVTVRNAKLNAVESTVDVAPILRIYTGTKPANTAAAATGTMLVEMTLPSDWMGAASSGQKAKAGTWQDASANATGDAGYFRIYDSAGTTCHIQGTVTITGNGGDMTLNKVNITTGDNVEITSFTLIEGNA
jgi:hypothetical protein